MSKDYLPEELFWPSAALYGLGFVFMDYYPLRTLIDDGLLFMARRHGTVHQRATIEVYNKILDIKESLLCADSRTLLKFFLEISKLPSFEAFVNSYSQECETILVDQS